MIDRGQTEEERVRRLRSHMRWLPWVAGALPVLHIAGAVQHYRAMYSFARAARLPATVVQVAVDEYWQPDFMRSHAGYELYLEKSLDAVVFHVTFAILQVVLFVLLFWIARQRLRDWDARLSARGVTRMQEQSNA